MADFTYIWTAEGWLYVAAVIDLFSRRVVGWSMTDLPSRLLTARRHSSMPSYVHHYVPRFYLKSWTDETKMLWEFQRPWKDVIFDQKYPAATGYQIDLYTVPGVPNGKETVLEDVFLKLVDTHASAAFEILLRGRVSDLSDEHLNGWTRFLMSLIHRDPATMAQRRARFDAEFEKVVAELQPEYGNMRKPGDPEIVLEFVGNAGTSLRATSLQKHLMRLMDFSRLGTLIKNMV